MGVNLVKGANLSLTKSAPTMQVALFGLGWDARTTTGTDFDLDASALLVGAEGKVRSDADFIFFNQPKSSCGSVEHLGDNRTGVGDGDDEVIRVRLGDVPADVDRVVFFASIYDGQTRSQSFGMVRGAYIRVTDEASSVEIGRYDLTEDASTETAMAFGEMYRNGSDWKFRAVGQGYAAGLAGVASDYGVNV